MTVLSPAPAPPVEAAPAAAADTPTRPVRRVVWSLAAAGPAAPARPLAQRRIAVIGGDRATAERTRAVLRERGADVLESAGEADFGRTVPDTVVDLTLAERFEPGAFQPWRPALLRTFAALRACYRRWSQEDTVAGTTYLAVTYLGGGMGYHGDDDLAQPLGGLWAGLAKTLHRELPNCAARIVDVALADAARVPHLVAEELGLGGLSEIGHRDGRRLTLTPQAHRPGPATVEWGPEDTVLISGGGRGIGAALARSLAARHGLRVVVTGRSALPPEDTWAGLTPAALEQRRAELWATYRSGRPVSEIRGAITRAEHTWATVQGLLRARSEGLRVEYRACDVTDPAQVRALVAELPALTGVIHNAGLDRPARLPRKTDADITDVVATKIDAFVHLFEAVRDRDLKAFCTVGSLTGRLGGMVGQFDYAAANDGLARLGLWAQRHVTFPVTTLAWPTWARLGLIANFEASLRYMAAMDIGEGLAHWQAELAAGSRGEVSFIGPLGAALDPVQAVGHPLDPCLPDYAQTYPKIFHLGTAERYRPHELLLSTVEFDATSLSAMGDFTVHGAPAVPAALLLDSAVHGALWVTPEGPGAVHLLALRDVMLPLSLLRAGADGRVRLLREIRGAHRDGRWTVDVRFRPADPQQPGEARVRLVYGTPGETATAAGEGRSPAAGVLFTDRPALHWRALTVPLATWRPAGPGTLTAEVPRCRPADLWTLPRPPGHVLPVAALENILRATTRRTPGLSATPDPLTLDHLALHGPEPERARITADPALGVWRVTDAATGAPVAVLHALPGKGSHLTTPEGEPS
ncbi:KR domain-containing protein [Streptomyces xanthochromogenes]|uniref:KR domain-containing protein n=1 Tax=Streptomyces xanthochromogenes TaxID=67384 RepID=UPI003430270D